MVAVPHHDGLPGLRVLVAGPAPASTLGGTPVLVRGLGLFPATGLACAFRPGQGQGQGQPQLARAEWLSE